MGQYGLGDKELRELQLTLLKNPDAGDVIPDLAGARKIRIPTGRVAESPAEAA